MLRDERGEIEKERRGMPMIEVGATRELISLYTLSDLFLCEERDMRLLLLAGMINNLKWERKNDFIMKLIIDHRALS